MCIVPTRAGAWISSVSDITDCFYCPVKASSLESTDWQGRPGTHAGHVVLPWCPSVSSSVHFWVPMSLVSGKAKNLPAMQEPQVQPLGREDPLEKKIASHSSILAWRIPWMEEPDRLEYMGSQRIRHDWATNIHTHTHTHLWNLNFTKFPTIKIPLAYLLHITFKTPEAISWNTQHICQDSKLCLVLGTSLHSGLHNPLSEQIIITP